MILLVPASLFIVRYEVAQGQPYSDIDQLILQSVVEGHTSLSNLYQIFHIHRRLLIQSLITMINDGWIALGNSNDRQFVATDAGRRALEMPTLPESIAVRERQAKIFLERVTGGVILENEVSYAHKTRLSRLRDWEAYPRLPIRVFENRIDEGQVYHMLPKQRGQRLHWVEEIRLASKGEHYIPISVESEGQPILNWPGRYQARLRPYVENKIAQEAAQQRELVNTQLAWNDLGIPFNPSKEVLSESSDFNTNLSVEMRWTSDSLINGATELKKLLFNILARAETTIAIASDYMTVERLEQIKSALINALARGVDVDLLGTDNSGGACLRWLKRFSYETRSETGILRFVDSPSGGANYIMWDEEKNNLQAVVGTYQWLANEVENANVANEIQFGVRIDHPTILSHLARYIAARWSRSSLVPLTSVPDKWRWMAAKLEEQVSADGDAVVVAENIVSISLIIDREHTNLLYDLGKAARNHLLIVTPSIGSGAINEFLRLTAEHKDSCSYNIVYSGLVLNPDERATFHEIILLNGSDLQYIFNMGTNIVINDRSVCLTTYNVLNPPINNGQPVYALGVRIDGKVIADTLRQRIIAMVSADPPKARQDSL